MYAKPELCPGFSGMPLQYPFLLIPENSNAAVNRPFGEIGQTQKPVLEASYRIQLGAFSSKQRALDSWKLSKKGYPELLESRELILDSATVKGKNYHRVQTGPMSRPDAWAICDRLKAEKQNCVVRPEPQSLIR